MKGLLLLLNKFPCYVGLHKLPREELLEYGRAKCVLCNHWISIK